DSSWERTGYMRFSVPTIPLVVSGPTLPRFSVNEAIERVSAFLSHGNVTVLTGAGVSVDSGIRAYRGSDGRYMNPNYKPIFYHQLVDQTDSGHTFRQRYWLRSYLGYPSVRRALPNPTHLGLAALQHTNVAPRIITQNVDGLHHRALDLSPEIKDSRILELHGSLHHVHCKHGHTVDRVTFQDWLSVANPRWKAFAEETERTGERLRTNPDGDVAIEHLGQVYRDFVVPECPECQAEGRANSIHKPEIVFFGESIPGPIRDQSFHDVEKGGRLLIVGTTLATYSAFRYVRFRCSLSRLFPIAHEQAAETRC
ncbi:unnamed protein product, partial [Mycena citricolor]